MFGLSGGKTRASLYGVVGAYLLYMAFGLFQGLGDPDTTMKPAIQILFIVFFTAVGIVLLAAAVRMWRHISREEGELLENMREEQKRAEKSGTGGDTSESEDAPADEYQCRTGDDPEAGEQNAGTLPDQKKGDIR